MRLSLRLSCLPTSWAGNMDKTFSAQTSDELHEYLEKVFQPEDNILSQIRVNSDKAGLPHIHVGSFDGLHLEVLTRAFGAKKIVEIGTLGGYSGVCLLRGAGPKAKLFTFELNPENAKVAAHNFELAGVREQVEIHIGPAKENLSKVEPHGPFDLVFIDADKNGYPAYLDWAHKNLKIGGVVLGDNTLAFGHLATPEKAEERVQPMVQSLRKFNESCAQDSRFRATMLPTGEGLTVAVKL